MARIPTAEIVVNGKRKIVNADDPRVAELAAPESVTPESREDVQKLKKADVIDFLEAHGAEFDKAAKVDDLRALLADIMFVSE